MERTTKTKKVTQELRNELKRLIDNPKGIDNRHTFGLQSLLVNEILIFEKNAEDYDPQEDDFEPISEEKPFNSLSLKELKDIYDKSKKLEEENKLLKIKYPTRASQLNGEEEDFNVNEFIDNLDKKEEKKTILENNIEQKPKDI